MHFLHYLSPFTICSSIWTTFGSWPYLRKSWNLFHFWAQFIHFSRHHLYSSFSKNLFGTLKVHIKVHIKFDSYQKVWSPHLLLLTLYSYYSISENLKIWYKTNFFMPMVHSILGPSISSLGKIFTILTSNHYIL